MSLTNNEIMSFVKEARNDLCIYSSLIDPTYQPNRFHRLLARELEAAVEQGYGRIMIFAPPQHGKSEIVSRKFPSWVLGKHPDWPIIAASYGDDLVNLNGQAVRSNIANPLHKLVFPDSELDKSTKAKDYFLTTKRGQYLGVTVRGGGTGFPSRLFIIDDPFKSRAEAESETFRQHVKDWYRSVCYTRLAENSILVIMHTRWHNDDLAGWLLKEHAHENWKIINLPALAEEDDLLGRKVGEPLVPERFSAAELDKKRVAVGSRDWVALYQQRPTEQGGSVFKHNWLRHYDSKTVSKAVWAMNRYLLIDPARTQKKTSDYTAMLVIGLHVDGNYYLLDAVYDRLTLKQRAEKVIELHRKWKPVATGYKKTGFEQDIEYLDELQNNENYRFVVYPLLEKGAKEARIERLAPDFENGRVWLPETLWKTNSAGEVKDVIHQFVEEEYKSFPAGVHDDFFDCLSAIKDVNAKWPRERRVNRSKNSGVLLV